MTELTDTQNAVRAIVALRLGWRDASPPLTSHLLHDLYCDAEAIVDIIEHLEERFGFTATDDDIQQIQVVGDLARLVDQHVSAVAANLVAAGLLGLCAGMLVEKARS